MSDSAVAEPLTTIAPGTRSTAFDLQQKGLTHTTPSDQFRNEILRLLGAWRAKGLSREEAIQSLLPTTILPETTYEEVTAALVSGAHLLFFGPSGSGKTRLAKDLWNLYPKGAWVIPECPVLDHPLSIVDAKTASRFPPCPVCQRRFSPEEKGRPFDPTTVDPTVVPAEWVQLREGYGFARLQGSSEVFPDHLTGNVNLRKLEELGDPMNPLVMEPGKLLQANRGILLIDEIGKLPLGTQNVLLQALQEGSVTPAKSRESFPAAFLALCTSNLSDLDNINDPLSDRLTSIHVEFNIRHAANRQIVDLEYTKAGGDYLPEVLLDAGVRIIELWRSKNTDDNPDVGEVGSNRTLVDVAYRTSAFATLAGHALATSDDLKAGILHSMRGRIRARSGEIFLQNVRRISEFIDKNLEELVRHSALVYWCRYYRTGLREDKSAAEELIGEGRRLVTDAALADSLSENNNLFPRFRAFRAYVNDRENPSSSTEAALVEFALLEKYSLFRCEKGMDDDVR